jgi:ABC-type oligopeptide transport system substrate-binding subunit
MKKNYSMFLALVLIAAITVSGCKKSSSKSKTQYLTQGTWKIDDAGLDAARNGTVQFSQLDECMEDNVITINANGNGSVSEGADVCDGEEATSTFTWAFSGDEKTVTIGIDAIGEVKIYSLNDTEMKVYKETELAGQPVWALIILKH